MTKESAPQSTKPPSAISRAREVFEQWLARTGDYRVAAQRAGVSERTGRRWKAEPRTPLDSGVAVVGSKTTVLGEPTRFIGRNGALGAIHKLFAEGARIVSLLGPAGIGKTRLVLRYADLHASSYPGGVFFCDVSTATSADALCAAIAKTLSVQLSSRGSDEDRIAQLGHALASRTDSLLVLDNLEQVVSVAAPLVGAIANAAPRTTLLQTSRVQLRTQGEVAWQVEALGTPQGAVNAKAALASEAIELFVDRAQLVRSGYVLTDADAPIVAQITQRLDGNALAIELAAARMGILTPAQILARLEKRFDLLVGGARDAPTRQVSMRAALDGSWDLLTEHERAALAQASVFVGGFSLEAAEHVLSLGAGAAEVLDVLESLSQSSLVRARTGLGSEVRFMLYETVRDYAREQLDKQRGHEARRRFARYFKGRACEWQKAVDRAGGAEVRALAATDMENVLAAHAGAVLVKDAELAFDIALCLAALLPGRNRTERDVYERTLSQETNDQARVVRVLAARGNAERTAGDVDIARATYEDALARSKPLKDPGLVALAWTGLGVVHQNAGRHLDAIAAYEKALPLAERAKDEELVGRTLGHLGVAHRVVRHDEEAMAYSQRAYASHKKAGATRLLATEALAMGTVYQQHGEPERARQRYEEASELTRSVGDEGLEASVLGTLGTLYGELGEVDLALSHYQRAYDISVRLGLKRLEGLALGNLATLHFQLNRLDDARGLMQRAVQVIEAAGDELHQGIFTAHLAGILAAQGALKDAESLIVDAEKVLSKRDPHAWGPAVSLQHAWIELAKAKRAASAAEAERWRESVRVRIENIPHEASDDVRVNVRMLRLALAAPMDSTTEIDPHALTITEDAALVRTPIGSRIELDRRRNVRLVLKALVLSHATRRGEPLSVDDLLAAGWPGEKVLREAGASRVYVALGTLRKLGLRDAIKSRDGGYLLDPELKVVVTKPQGSKTR